jgi:hypothetical protein
MTTSFNTSDRCRRGEGKEGGRGWDDAQSDRLFFHGEPELKKEGRKNMWV